MTDLPETVSCTSYLDDSRTVEVPRDQLKLRIGAYAIITRELEGVIEVLMIEGADHGKFFPPGGGLELGESLLECVERELREETGLVLDSALPWRTFEGFAHYEPDAEFWQCINHCYRCKVIDANQTPVSSDPAEGQPKWVNLETVPRNKLQHTAKDILEALRAYISEQEPH